MSRQPVTSVPLAHYRTHEGCGVTLQCRGCRLLRDFDLETVIARLDARGLDGANVGIRDVADYVNQPCPRCGGRSFDSRPAWDFGRAQAPPHPPYGGF